MAPLFVKGMFEVVLAACIMRELSQLRAELESLIFVLTIVKTKSFYARSKPSCPWSVVTSGRIPMPLLLQTLSLGPVSPPRKTLDVGLGTQPVGIYAELKTAHAWLIEFKSLHSQRPTSSRHPYSSRWQEKAWGLRRHWPDQVVDHSSAIDGIRPCCAFLPRKGS